MIGVRSPQSNEYVPSHSLAQDTTFISILCLATVPTWQAHPSPPTPSSSGPLNLTHVGRLGGWLIPLSDLRYSFANSAQDILFLPLLSSAWIRWVRSGTIPWTPRTWMKRKNHRTEVLACHPQAASLGPGARMLAWIARTPQKRPRLGPGLCTTTVSSRAVCSKLAFLRPRIEARHLVQVPQGSEKWVSQRQGGTFSSVASPCLSRLAPPPGSGSI